MDRLVYLYLASILAGFAMAFVPTSSLVTEPIANFFEIVGGVVILVFSLALVHLGLKALFTKHFN
ncbi:hypothetical protein GMD78_13630 [Ornithinibacillus sp. L9]|uniref:Uncharacterized protein n=1 Tax=Ornithinibacillus caprae TaxID=2678566 RepID=A0A6N8FLZ9_9BACI|nr:hypothetical protein [Ornithinibacillus caprae]MUK89404.1 hypothetical protein [Ornithinibacillus caprae]